MDRAPVNESPGERLRRWRTARDPKLTVHSAATQVGVKHPTWVDWEGGNRSPSLEKAIAIEELTEGDVRVELWGFDRSVMVSARRVLGARDDASTRRRSPRARRVSTPPAQG